MRDLRPGLRRCPAHEDRSASLSVTRTAEGKYLLHCFAGCDTEAILRALGLTWEALFPDSRPVSLAPRRVLSEEDRAVQAVHLRAERARARRELAEASWRLADTLRDAERAVAACRTLATQVGEDVPGVWAMLERAARVESLIAMIESEHP